MEKKLEQLELFPRSAVQAHKVEYVSNGRDSHYRLTCGAMVCHPLLLFITPNGVMYTYRLQNVGQTFKPV